MVATVVAYGVATVERHLLLSNEEDEKSVQIRYIRITQLQEVKRRVDWTIKRQKEAFEASQGHLASYRPEQLDKEQEAAKTEIKEQEQLWKSEDEKKEADESKAVL